MASSRIRIGCIADDFTGAGDAASFLAAGGLKTLLLIWPHCEGLVPEDYDAVVVALKSRSVDPALAASESLAALDWLRSVRAEKLYFKYCSTFDSTRSGNIGPVCDAILEKYHIPYTILCPSLISNHRTVDGGILYVNGTPLSESHMRHHPLNPMWSSSIKELMAPQSKYPCFNICQKEYGDIPSLKARIEKLAEEHEHFYLVPDHSELRHGEIIASLFEALPFWTGGSGLLGAFSEAHGRRSPQDPEPRGGLPDKGGRLMIVGSCSDMAKKQVKRWIDSSGKAVMIDRETAFNADRTLPSVAEEYISDPQTDLMFYSSGSSAELRREEPSPEASRAMERFMASLARYIYAGVGAKRLIVAGGETSGAVITALGYHAFQVGASIAPGVPILLPLGEEGSQIVLKSGNFGDEDFFLEALAR